MEANQSMVIQESRDDERLDKEIHVDHILQLQEASDSVGVTPQI